ncbi:hypothetical protein V8F33_005246 [Rhypophila sp. PSN 637]
MVSHPTPVVATRYCMIFQPLENNPRSHFCPRNGHSFTIGLAEQEWGNIYRSKFLPGLVSFFLRVDHVQFKMLVFYLALGQHGLVVLVTILRALSVFLRNNLRPSKFGSIWLYFKSVWLLYTVLSILFFVPSWVFISFFFQHNDSSLVDRKAFRLFIYLPSIWGILFSGLWWVINFDRRALKVGIGIRAVVLLVPLALSLTCFGLQTDPDIRKPAGRISTVGLITGQISMAFIWWSLRSIGPGNFTKAKVFLYSIILIHFAAALGGTLMVIFIKDELILELVSQQDSNSCQKLNYSQALSSVYIVYNAGVDIHSSVNVWRSKTKPGSWGSNQGQNSSVTGLVPREGSRSSSSVLH